MENFQNFVDLVEVSDHFERLQILLINRRFDSLSLRSEPLSFLPAHLLEHLEANILTSQFELLVIWIIWLSAFLQGL